MQPIFLHIFYSIPHSAAVQAKNVLPHKILRCGETQKVLCRDFSIQRLFDCIIYSFCSFATRRRTAVTRPQSTASTVYRTPISSARNRRTDILIVINNVCQRADFFHRQFRFLRCRNLCTSRVYKMRFDLFDFLKLGKQLCRQWNSAAAADSHNQSFFHQCTIPASMLTAGVTQSFQKIAIGKIKTIAGIISATGNCLILHILKPVASMIKPPHALKSLMM